MDTRIRSTLDYIENNLDLSFNLKELAQKACLSPSQFHRVFKKETNRTPHQFIEEIKLNKAYLLLINGTDSVLKIAMDLGYKDYETFSRAFKRLFKFSPDGIRSITAKLKEEIIEQDGEVIIATLDVLTENEVESNLKQLAENLNISKETIDGFKDF